MNTKKIKFRFTEYEAVELKPEEFDRIWKAENTPEFVVTTDGIGWFNERTCHNGYRGTCNCVSHDRKRWVRFNPDTGDYWSDPHARSIG